MKHSIEEARAAKEKIHQLLTGNARVVGIGITRVGDSYAVKVNLQDSLPEDEKVPTAVNGVPVKLEVVGKIRKQQVPTNVR